MRVPIMVYFCPFVSGSTKLTAGGSADANKSYTIQHSLRRASPT